MTTSENSDMNTCEKYCVTLRCFPEAECAQHKSANQADACVSCYEVYAVSGKAAVDDAFGRHMCHCSGRPGICEMRVEVERVCQELID
jgi:hypothetical protein